MSLENSSHAFWLGVVAISDSIRQERISTEQLVCMLTGIEEGFASRFDPADSFHEYAALELCRSIRGMLDTDRVGHDCACNSKVG